MPMYFHKLRKAPWVQEFGEGLSKSVYTLLWSLRFSNTTSAQGSPTSVLLVCPHTASETPHPSQINLSQEISVKSTFSPITTLCKSSRFGVKRLIRSLV